MTAAAAAATASIIEATKQCSQTDMALQHKTVTGSLYSV